MKLAALALVAAAAVGASQGGMRNGLIAMERVLDQRLAPASATDAMTLMGNTRGVYLEGYGAVFTAEVNLFGTAVMSPFRALSKKEVAEVRQRKSDRIPVLKQQMRTALIGVAASLDMVPMDEQIVFGVSLFYYRWENAAGMPTQLVMRAPRKVLVAASKGDASALNGALTVQEY